MDIQRMGDGYDAHDIATTMCPLNRSKKRKT